VSHGRSQSQPLKLPELASPGCFLYDLSAPHQGCCQDIDLIAGQEPELGAIAKR
jgi:hypothetical protein